MSLSSIIILLQAVISLLSNPTTASNPQAQLLAQNSILIATQALQNQTTTVTTTPAYIPPVQVGNNIDNQNNVTIEQMENNQTSSSDISGTPTSLGQVQPAVIPSCTLIVKTPQDAGEPTGDSRDAVLIWTSNLSGTITGSMYAGQQVGMGDHTEFQWRTEWGGIPVDGRPIDVPNGKHFTGNGLLTQSIQFKLVINGNEGQAECEYTWNPS